MHVYKAGEIVATTRASIWHGVIAWDEGDTNIDGTYLYFSNGFTLEVEPGTTRVPFKDLREQYNLAAGTYDLYATHFRNGLESDQSNSISFVVTFDEE
jgi:hypothetical protein